MSLFQTKGANVYNRIYYDSSTMTRMCEVLRLDWGATVSDRSMNDLLMSTYDRSILGIIWYSLLAVWESVTLFNVKTIFNYQTNLWLYSSLSSRFKMSIYRHRYIGCRKGVEKGSDKSYIAYEDPIEDETKTTLTWHQCSSRDLSKCQLWS